MNNMKKKTPVILDSIFDDLINTPVLDELVKRIRKVNENETTGKN